MDMTKINFEQLAVYTDISKKNTLTGDVRESFSNILYTRANGVRMHALAMKIYQSEGSTDYDDEELRMILSVAEGTTTPAFFDSLKEHIKTMNNESDLQ